jgi:glycosyltransferase involved in cell wall biosynthesis
VVLIKALEDDRPATLDKFEVDEIISFRYSFDDNQYYVQKSLANHLGYDRGALVTDTSIAIEAKVRFKVPKTLFHLIHDFFYVHQQFKYQQVIDVVITHSSFFRDAIFASDPQLFSGRNFYIPYGVKQLTTFPQKRNNSILNLVFLGRLDELKGVFLLNEIDDLLLGLKIPVNWTIIGKGHSKEKLLIQWQGKNNVQFFEPDTTEAVY